MNTYWNKYSPKDNWYEDCEPDYSCSDCEKKELEMLNAAEFLNSIVKQLYNKEKLDTAKLESDLDTLCHLLHVKIGEGEMQIQHKKEKVPTFLSDWIQFNNGYLHKTNKIEKKYELFTK